MKTTFKKYILNIITEKDQSLLAQIVKVFLWLISLLYGLIIRFICLMYDAGLLKSKKVDAPVVCVGNITLGGVGKTPLVAAIASHLEKTQHEVIVLMRGYMNDGLSDSDEAQLLKQKMPWLRLYLGSNRYASATQALKEHHIDLFLMDDGFQHWSLSRDLDVVAIDATNPFGNNNLIPAGLLREPKAHLKRADIFVLTKCAQATHADRLEHELTSKYPSTMIVQTTHSAHSLTDLHTQETYDLGLIDKKKVAAFCSIGSPQSFKQSLKTVGADVDYFCPFIDHHSYTDSDIKELTQKCSERGISTIITTEKDAVKLMPFLENLKGIDLYSLNISIQFLTKEREFFDKVASVLHR